jgi:hypothetical protein
MRAGRLSYTKVRAMTRVATVGNEHVLLKIAENGTASHIETVVRHYRRTQRTEELHRDAERHRRRTFRYYWDHDGSLVIEGRLPPEQGALVVQALKAADQALREASGSPAPVAAAPSECLTPTAVDPSMDDAGEGSRRDAGADPAPPAFGPVATILDPSNKKCWRGCRSPRRNTQTPLTRTPSADTVGRRHVRRRCEPRRCPDAASQVRLLNRTFPRKRARALLDWGQRQADALTLLAETMLARGACSRHGADRHLLHVHVDISTLCAPMEKVAARLKTVRPSRRRRCGAWAATRAW